ncbi:ATP-grasp domain-containing protein [Candidatus Woesearchaeota archaeon]|nr:ATP-grasp domain-containing protein [Candidatus Woesearchaeota archaeon]
MAKVFVTDAEQGRIPLNVTRSLGAKKIKVFNGGYLNAAPVYFSRYSSKKVIYPNISDKPKKFKEFIFKYIKENKFDVVFPVMNENVLFFSKHKKELSKYTAVPLVDYKTMIRAMDKGKIMRFAEKIGIPHPKTYYPRKISELDIVVENLNFPVIVKAKRSSGSRGVKICSSFSELKKTFADISKSYGKPIVQEYIPQEGDAIGVSCLFGYDHKEKAVFTHKRIRQYPIKGGPSTLRQSIRHPTAEKIAIKLLRKLKWFGLAMVEFKVDPRDGKPKLIEINPRFWGSLALPIAAGVNFPYLLYNLAVKKKIKPIKNYKLDVKSRWLAGDFLYFLSMKHKLKFLPKFLNFFEKNTYYDEFMYKDFMPLFGRFLSLFYVFDKKLTKKVIRDI